MKDEVTRYSVRVYKDERLIAHSNGVVEKDLRKLLYKMKGTGVEIIVVEDKYEITRRSWRENKSITQIQK